MSDIENAIRFALKIHSGQRDKAGAPYILHPLRVMLSMEHDTEQQVAVLHDVVEDGNITNEMLISKGFSKEVCLAVAALTKASDESYSEYLSRLEINPIARAVKIADLNDNLNLDRIKNPGKKDKERIVKYKKALEFLKEDKKYKVYVDENSHYKDSSHRYLKGYYVDCQAAINVCKKIVDDFLINAYDGSKTGDQLWNEYSSWGEDPFIIVTVGEGNCSFSAWDYAKNRIREIVEDLF